MERGAHVSAKCERVVKNSLQAVTKRGTIVSNMSTIIKTDSLSATLFGKTRRAVLAFMSLQNWLNNGFMKTIRI